MPEATEEFWIYSFNKRNGDLSTRLIKKIQIDEAIAEGEKPEEYFFESGCTEVVHRGVIQVMGDIEMLSERYIED